MPEILDGTSNTILISEDAGRPDRWQAGKLITVNGQLDGGWADHNNEVYSFHSGGANHVMADGSVRFISASMSIREFVKLVTRSGQEVINDF